MWEISRAIKQNRASTFCLLLFGISRDFGYETDLRFSDRSLDHLLMPFARLPTFPRNAADAFFGLQKMFLSRGCGLKYVGPSAPYCNRLFPGIHPHQRQQLHHRLLSSTSKMPRAETASYKVRYSPLSAQRIKSHYDISSTIPCFA